MTFPILGGNGAVAGYSIDNSLRFNDDDSPDLSFAQSTPTDGTRWTWSGWIKRGNLSNGSNAETFASSYNGTNTDRIQFTEDNELQIEFKNGSSTVLELHTSQLFRDVSAWSHIIVAFDSNLTQADRVKIYVNGARVTSFSTESQLTTSGYTTKGFNASSKNFVLGAYESSSKLNHFDGYIAETHFIDGSAKQPSDFGEFDEDSGIWKPIQYTGSYGTNGFYLDFENSGSLGADQSGNGNNFTPTNLASTDQTTDTPTNNFATLNPLVINRWANAGTPSEGNTEIKWTTGDADTGIEFSTMGVTSGKWYWEVKMPVVARAMVGVGYMQDIVGNTNVFYDNNPSKGFALAYNGSLQYDATSTTYGSSFSNNDILQVALDMDNHLCWFGLNGTWQNSATQSEIENSTATNDATTKMGTQQNLNSGQLVFPFVIDPSTTGQSHFQMNFGNPSFSISSGNSDGNGYGNFEYAPPSGYLALCTQNLATELSPTIDDGSQYFNTVLYTGNSSTNNITGVGFQPDWLWIKGRSASTNHRLFDSTRGNTKYLASNNTDAEGTDTTALTSFDSDGFSLVSDGQVNGSGTTYVSWNWKANGGTTSSNTDGSITSTVQANTTAGFSIVQFTKTGDDQAVGHGLGKKPKLIIIKPTNTSGNWIVMPEIDGVMSNKYLLLNGTDALGTDGSYAEPTSSVFYVSNQVAGNNTHIGYVFTDIEGYSKFGSYTGNGNSNGTFVYTGFRPAFVIFKRTDSTTSWRIMDTARDSFNVAKHRLFASGTDADNTGQDTLDFLSNGFKHRATNSGGNANGGSYIYMCFAENPFVDSNGIPVTAR